MAEDGLRRWRELAFALKHVPSDKWTPEHHAAHARLSIYYGPDPRKEDFASLEALINRHRAGRREQFYAYCRKIRKRLAGWQHLGNESFENFFSR